MNVPESVLVLIPILVGAVGVPLVNWLKGKLNLAGIKALWLAFGVSVVLAVAALLFTGSFVIPSGDPLAIAGKIIEWIGVVFATATMIYKGIELKPGLPADPVG
jgi:hypothetical protein